MLATALLSWWYGDGWRQIRVNTAARTKRVSDSFSVPSLLKTLFAPWRKIYTDAGTNIADQFKAMQDNFVSRLVGFAVRSTVLFAAGAVILGMRLTSLVQVVLWPLVPPAVVILILLGLWPS